MFLDIWKRCFPTKVVAPKRPTDLSSDIAALEAMQARYSSVLADMKSRARLEERRTGLIQKLKYDESADSLLDL